MVEKNKHQLLWNGISKSIKMISLNQVTCKGSQIDVIHKYKLTKFIIQINFMLLISVTEISTK